MNTRLTHTRNKGMIEDNSEGIGDVSGEMVWARSEDFGMIAGRPLNNVDYGQALCELTGEPKVYAKQASLESATEDKRWDPVPGSKEHQAMESASEDEDEDGRSESAQLVGEGVSEAEHDQMVQAANAVEI